jgi:hypothetical protein
LPLDGNRLESKCRAMVSMALTKRTPCPLWECRPGIRQRSPSTLSRRCPAFLEHGLKLSVSDGFAQAAQPAREPGAGGLGACVGRGGRGI